jgi:sortase (surface protein transpeptidase)
VQEQPVRIRIPALKVNSPIIPAAVDSAGALVVPANVYQAAWSQAGNAAGQPGTAIIAAHVDFAGALGLFNGLHTLPKGAAIYVTDASGHVRVFHVASGTLAPKSDPSTVESLAAAAARPGQPRLALITCGGDLNVAKHSYYDNFVLLADL